MDIKSLRSTLEEFIYEHKSFILKTLWVILGVIVLTIVFIVSSDEWNVSQEANMIADNIEQRKYSLALENYSNWEEEFSDSKMNRLNDSISKKINILMFESSDQFISKQISKEHFSGIINTINMLDRIEVDSDKIIEQASRINDMYLEENIDYDLALDYMSLISMIRQVEDDIDVYIKDLNEINKSREIYEHAEKNQNDKNYHEAIEDFKMVIQEDEEYYKKAQNNIEKCIEDMYSHYIDEAKLLNSRGEYEQALKYIQYIKPYYQEDETIIELERKYQENLSLYTLTTDDIIGLIINKSDKNVDNLTVEAYRVMLEDKNYYYTEVYEFDYLVNILLINPLDNKMYSQRDFDHIYTDNEYVDGYFKILEDGDIEFSISKEEASFVIEKVLAENNPTYKNVEFLEKNNFIRHIDGDIDELLNGESDIYYYFRVDNGWFKAKQEFVINMYTSQVYEIENSLLKSY